MSTSTSPQTRRRAPSWTDHGVLVIVGAIVLGLSACSSGGGGVGGSSSSPTEAPPSVGASPAADLVPADIKAKGTLTVAVDPTFPPSGYYDDQKKLVGADVELGAALAQTLGLKPDVVATSFDSIIPGLQAGRYNVGMSLINITAEREQTLDLVGYFENGSSIMAPEDTTLPSEALLTDLCGHSVAVQRAAVQASMAEKQSAACTGGGKEKVDVQVFPDYDSATLAVANHRVDAGLFDQTNAAYTASQQASKLKVIGQPIDRTPCGVAVAKGNGLAAAVEAGLKNLLNDGVYEKILANHNLQAGKVTEITVNPKVG
jgi:polar amino acid transport system substrate-binding protein